MRVDTLGAVEFLKELKLRWKLEETTLRESEIKFVVIQEKGLSAIILVGEYNKLTRKGYILGDIKYE